MKKEIKIIWDYPKEDLVVLPKSIFVSIAQFFASCYSNLKEYERWRKLSAKEKKQIKE